MTQFMIPFFHNSKIDWNWDERTMQLKPTLNKCTLWLDTCKLSSPILAKLLNSKYLVCLQWLQQQCNWHGRKVFMGNPPTQETASQGHNDVLYCTCHMVAIPASPHLQLLGAATRGHQYKYRVPYCRTRTYIKNPSSHEVSGCGISCQKNWQPLNPYRDLQGRDFSRHTALDSKMFLSCF